MAGGKGAPGKKAVQKEKDKLVQDKTFGLKNKKNAKVQKYVAQVKQQVQNQGQKKRNATDPPKSKKEEEKERKAELNQIFKPVTIQQKVDVGVDPKSVLCQFFKQGLCTKGAKCKFSHDLEVTRKVEKINLYVDQRDLEEEKKKDVMDDWDQSKLASVIGQKHKDNHTEIVCKFFLAAIETKKYGWFWECPNGGDACPYRHALPPGFQLKSKEKQPEDEGPKISVEEEIEEARRKLVGEGTPVTLERFLKWKADKKAKAEKEKADREKELGVKERGPKSMMNGREMFVFNPDLFVDDEEAFEEYEKEEEEFDPSVPHNIVTVTSTSITLTAKKNDEKANGDDVGAVDESLFVDDGEVPDVSDDEADP
eukprot:TRINITY_DN12896_c0_g1_i1.p1 TRINITY_DN12896_c0_g1~~TRINITY_DN12896_c0_g1_i1.p1  ORF type:complete len:367 (-),score=133.60 TRINITY_DN12896_c0_g1_i1:215-1315(-)